MRILLLQDQVYIPSLGGGNKANRLLLEALADRGHACAAVVRAFTTRAGPGNPEELEAEVRRRGARLESPAEGRYAFRHRGVAVTALDFGMAGQLRQHILDTIEAFRPDWVLLSDDKQRFLLETAVTAAPTRVVLLLQTVSHLPFGPHAREPSQPQWALMARTPRIAVISQYFKDYLRLHGGLESTVVKLPLFGPGPFHARDSDASGFVTLVNPCVEKGLDIFLALAKEFPAVRFAAVPTWGADAKVQAALAAAPNVTILPPADDIDEILAQTRILLAPSLWPETFGYIVVEAMLHGIPVLASDRGGLPEAKLGVDYTLPVRPLEWRDGACVSPAQDIRPWAEALRLLLTDESAYRRCAAASFGAATAFAAEARPDVFEAFLQRGPV